MATKQRMTPEEAGQQLEKLVGRLKSKEVLRSMRGALRKTAGIVKRAAVRELKSTGVHNAGAIGKGIRAKAKRKADGFIVAANATRAKGVKGGYHRNRRGKEKPVAFWLNVGTIHERPRRTSKGYGRGVLDGSYTGYMERAEASTQSTVARELIVALAEKVSKTVDKYGNL